MLPFEKLKEIKWPSLNQWGQLFSVLKKKEKVLFILLLFLFFSSLFFLSHNFYLRNTSIKPSQGGTLIEGVVGQPRFINPIYISSNDVDRDLVQLTFRGLMKYNSEGEVIPDLVKDYEIKEEGKLWEVTLKSKIFWQDGEPITTDDVVFTIKTIQNSDYKAPQRVNWLGVEITKITDKKLRFKLKNPYPQFLENLTLKIIPKHAWKDILAEDFPLSPYNLKPIGSGPFQVEEIKQEKSGFINSLTLIKNPYSSKTFISKIIFKFFKNQEDLLKAAQNHNIDAFSNSSLNGFNNYRFLMPRYFAVFLNSREAEVLSNKNIRRALNYATNKKEVVNSGLDGEAQVINSPILPEIYGFPKPDNYKFDLEKAKELLTQEGWKDLNNDGIREKPAERPFEFKRRLEKGSKGEEVKQLQKCLVKEVDYDKEKITSYFGNLTKKAVIKFQEKYKEAILKPWGFKSGTGIVGETTREKLNQVCFKKAKDTPLEISLVTVDQEQMKKVAAILKKQWKKAGVSLKVKTVSLNTLKSDFIKPRSYQALLFGESLGAIPDFYSFWHSSQKRDPGLNLANFDSEEADAILEEARQSLNQEERNKVYQQLQEIIMGEVPAIFLYNPYYIYNVADKVKGIKQGLIVEPSQRFNNINQWYINTTRAWR